MPAATPSVSLVSYVLILLCFFLTVSCNSEQGAKQSAQSANTVADSKVIEGYWERPVPLQGPVPASYSKLEASLYPEDCAVCHAAQHSDWSGSLHSKAMSPGLTSQLSPHDQPGFAASCYLCHSILTEQQEFVSTDKGYSTNPDFDARLRQSGVTCAGCHVRGNKRYGPPSLKQGKASGAQPHGGFTESSFFEESGFCKPCHQFPDNWRSINGKLIENTYEEWKASKYAAQGVTCQKCHMPGRQHLFKGIHDKETVLSGITIDVKPLTPTGVTMTVTNTGVGHNFPSYVTPLVIVSGTLIDNTGLAIPGTLQQGYIGWRVSLDVQREIADTRLAPGESFKFDYAPRARKEAAGIALEVWVEPDEFYNRFFKASLQYGRYASKETMEEALRITEESKYRLFRKEFVFKSIK